MGNRVTDDGFSDWIPAIACHITMCDSEKRVVGFSHPDSRGSITWNLNSDLNARADIPLYLSSESSSAACDFKHGVSHLSDYLTARC